MSVEEEPRTFNFSLKIDVLKIDVQQKIVLPDVREIYKVLHPLDQQLGEILGKFQQPTTAMKDYVNDISELSIQSVLAELKVSDKKILTVDELCAATKLSRATVDKALLILIQRGLVKREKIGAYGKCGFFVKPPEKSAPSVEVEDEDARKLRLEAEAERLKLNRVKATT